MIHIQNRSPLALQDELVTRAARATLERADAADAGLTVVLTDDDQLQALNREYLGLDAPTDVLAFPASDEPRTGEPDPETGSPYLGDVLISVPRAALQAQANGHAVEAEVQLLAVHGILHLLGHDHARPRDRARMWAAQSEVLERLGLADIRVHE
jgi:probable rRNA maturation factor